MASSIVVEFANYGACFILFLIVLEERASKWKQAKVPQSENEIKWLMSLVQAHGDDIEAMHMDVKRNVWQRTPGELRRA